MWQYQLKLERVRHIDNKGFQGHITTWNRTSSKEIKGPFGKFKLQLITYSLLNNITYLKRTFESLISYSGRTLIYSIYVCYKRIMYIDLSLVHKNTIDLNYLLKQLPQESYNRAAIDYEYCDTLVSKVPQQFLKLNSGDVKIYSRATLVIEQPASLHQLNQNQNDFDIMAVKPNSQKMFHTLCVEYDNYDIISFDIGVKLPFMIKRNPLYQALRKGKFLQIQYSSIFTEEAKVVAMTNMINIIKATGGKNLIVTSHVNNYKQHRTPFDVAALLSSLGLSKNLVLATMKENAETVLKSAIHRKFFKGTIKDISAIVVKKLGKKIQKHRQAIKGLVEKQKILKQA